MKASILILFLGIIFSISGQNKETWQKKSFTFHSFESNERYFINPTCGALLLMGTNDDYLSLKNRLTPCFNMNIGKYFSDLWSLHLTYSKAYIIGVGNESSNFITTNKIDTEKGMFEQKANISALNISLGFNLVNYFQNTISDNFTLDLYAGIGYLRSTDIPYKKIALSYNVGLINRFHLFKDLWGSLDLNNRFVNSSFTNEKRKTIDLSAIITLSIGVSYLFSFS